MKSFKKFLTENLTSYRNRGFAPRKPWWIYDKHKVENYGEKFNGTPEEFENFIKDKINYVQEEKTKHTQTPLGTVTGDYNMDLKFRDWFNYHAKNSIDYHLHDNPKLTDEHYHAALPHLLSHDYEGTIKNLDIPWETMKPLASMSMVASPPSADPEENKRIIYTFNQRDAYETSGQRQADEAKRREIDKKYSEMEKDQRNQR